MYKKCMQILNFDRNWLIFCRKHLCMVLQKCYFGKLLNKIFGPIFWPKKSKNDHFCPFFVIFPISRTKNHENPYFYKISKITFFYTLWGWYIWICSLCGSKLGICINLSKFRLKITFVFITLVFAYILRNLSNLTGRHFAKKSFFF